MTKEEEQIMIDKQEEILKKAGWKENENELSEALKRKKAYTPYSHFNVGCALELKDGTIIHGANVENASGGLSISERSVIFTMSGYDQRHRIGDVITANDSQPVSHVVLVRLGA